MVALGREASVTTTRVRPVSIFDFPRIHFAGSLRLNPGTANNEDYAQPGPDQALFPPGPNQGEPLGLLDTRNVAAKRFGMSDEEFVDWVQHRQHFKTPLGLDDPPIIPAEWNYYGDMSAITVDITVRGVQTQLGQVITQPGQPGLGALVGAAVTWTGTITDINPEGDPPATQFFIDDLQVAGPAGTYLGGGQTSKGVGLWINFFRNVNCVADDGSGTYVQHVIRGGTNTIPGFPAADGVVMRYTLSLPLLDDENARHDEVIEQYYRDRRANPKTLDIVGTLAPYYAGEPTAMPPGRQLISGSANIDTSPYTYNNGGGTIALAPVVISTNSANPSWLTLDLAGTFPEKNGRLTPKDPPTRDNPKYDFGDVSLYLRTAAKPVPLATVPYSDTAQGIQSGWLIDIDVSSAADGDAATLLAEQDVTFELHWNPQTGDPVVVASEVDYYVVTDELAVYAEQGGPNDEFLGQGVLAPLTVSVYHRGQPLEPSDCPPIEMWQYRAAPIQTPGAAVPRGQVAPGAPITVDASEAGAYLLTFRVQGETNPAFASFPPANYGQFAYPPMFALTWAPQISVRVLPNPDYSRYFVDPDADEPVGNGLLTWDVVYAEVLRTYALLYPAMNNKIRLDSEEQMTRFASYVIDATSMDRWMSSRYMPPTRDLSANRRKLLQAWCRGVGG